MLSNSEISIFRRLGHLTVGDVLNAGDVAEAIADVEAWSREFLEQLESDQRRWYLEDGGQHSMLRKLDNPAWNRPFFQALAKSRTLVTAVEQLIGPGVSVFFSQVFCKPPEVGGPKPVHQDNFYFGPGDSDATLTVWIALDDATVENGCLFYGDTSNHGPVFEHVAPPDEPYNLQVAPEHVNKYEMTAAPVPAGGISFHHGNTWHQSSANTSPRARRAVVFHYLRNDATLVCPALEYDESVVVRVSGSSSGR